MVIFLGCVLLLHPQATSRVDGGPRTSDFSIERQNLTNSPPLICELGLFDHSCLQKMNTKQQNEENILKNTKSFQTSLVGNGALNEASKTSFPLSKKKSC